MTQKTKDIIRAYTWWSLRTKLREELLGEKHVKDNDSWDA